jgi:competence protein ComEC
MRRRRFWLMFGFVIFLLHNQARAADPRLMDVHFIDVGQADSILIQTPQGKNLLVDAGDEGSGKGLADYMHSHGVVVLDAVIATHPHHDHIGGMSAIMKQFQVKAFYMPDLTHSTRAFRRLYEAVRREGIMIFQAKAGDKIDVEPGIKIRIVAPLKGGYDSLNEYSYVLKLVDRKNSFLFMADAGEQSETDLLEKRVNVRADIIKIGHHGANTGTTLPFLKKVNPDAAVISVGKGNRYGYPDKAVIQRLRYLKIPTYRTDLLGTIVAHSDGQRVSFTYGLENDHRSGRQKKAVIEPSANGHNKG